MEPKEKAKELRDKYINVRWDIYPDDAKQCALIAVNEIINTVDCVSSNEIELDVNYWQEVKQELEKL